jgi:hypothetical protein
VDPLHATIQEFAADGFTHVECYCPRCRVTRQRPISWLPRISMGLTIAQLSERLRCAECGSQIYSAKPWRMEDVLGKPLGVKANSHALDYEHTREFGVNYSSCSFAHLCPRFRHPPGHIHIHLPKSRDFANVSLVCVLHILGIPRLNLKNLPKRSCVKKLLPRMEYLLKRPHRIGVHLFSDVAKAIIEFTNGLAGHRFQSGRCGVLV